MTSLVGRAKEIRIGQSFFSELKKNRRCYYDGITAAVLLFVSQLLICGLQYITRKINDFPAPILAMVLVAAVMILVQKCVADIDRLYVRYLRRPTDLINRHMSIGFTVPFTMIMKDPSWTAKEVGLIVLGFIITGLLNTAAVYAVSYGVQTAISRVAEGPIRDLEQDILVETVERRGTMQGGDNLQDPGDSDVFVSSTLTGSPSVQYTSDDEERQQGQPPPLPLSLPRLLAQEGGLGYRGPEGPARSVRHLWARGWRLAVADPVPVLSFAGIVIVGLPTARATGNDVALDTFFLFFLWTSTLAAQSAVKKTRTMCLLCRHPRWRTVLATLLNAVLWTSLGTIAYTATKAAVKHVTITRALADFHTGTTLADLIYTGSRSGSGTATMTTATTTTTTTALTMGAGDIAASILDAGIVIWGLKLFECRAQLLSRAGLAALMVGSVFAVVSIVGGPLIVHAMGLAPARRALAFAARSVTIALAGPAMTNLGGDASLNAAMVVFNGIVFQVAMGLGVCQWAARMAGRVARRADLGSNSNSNSNNSNRSSSRSRSRGRSDGSRRRSNDDDDDSNRAHNENRQTLPESDVRISSGASSQAPTRRVSSSDEEAASDATRTVAAYDIEKSAGCIVSMRGGENTENVEDVGDAEDAEADRASCDSPRTVAVGMTVGINAAAMGTAYLYEEGPQAAPYAALSMTVFGVMVVVFTSIQPLAGWLMLQVA